MASPHGAAGRRFRPAANRRRLRQERGLTSAVKRRRFGRAMDLRGIERLLPTKTVAPRDHLRSLVPSVRRKPPLPAKSKQKRNKRGLVLP